MSSNEISLWDLTGIVRRHFALFLFGFVTVFVAAAVITFFLPRKYRSEAQISVKPGRENLGVDPTATSSLGNQGAISITKAPDQEINAIANILKSRNLSELVAQDLTPEVILSNDKSGFVDNVFAQRPELAEGFSPYHTLNNFDKAVYKLQDSIKIRPVKEANTIKIHYDCGDPELSQKIVNSFVKHYQEKHRELHRSKDSYRILRDEVVAKIFDDLKSKQNELAKVRKETGLIAVNQQRTNLVGRISTIRSALTQANADKMAISGEIKSLKIAFKNLDPSMISEETSGSGTMAATSMRTELFQLQIEEKRLSKDFDDDHYRVKNIRKQIKEIEAILKNEEQGRNDVVKAPSSAYLMTQQKLINKESELVGIEDRIAQFSTELNLENEKLLKSNEDELEIDRLESEIAILKSSFQKYGVDLEQARVEETLSNSEISNLKILTASINPFPVFPKVPLNLGIGFVLAIFSGMLLAIFGEQLESKKRNRQSFEQLQINSNTTSTDRPLSDANSFRQNDSGDETNIASNETMTTSDDQPEPEAELVAGARSVRPR